MRRSDFNFLSGNPALYHSSAGVTRQFCSRCGTGLTFATERHPDTIDITTASLDDPLAYPPTTEVWLEHRLSWQPASPDTEHFRGSSLD